MALKEEPYALPLKLGGQPFSKATACGANSCILASYVETPSIAWISTSPLVVDGVICALPKFTGWSQKSHLRAEWPFAVSIWKRPGAAKSFAFFVYHLAEAAYYVFKISSDAQTALMMGYERAAIVFKDSLLIYNLFDPTRPPISIPTCNIPQLLPSLCYASSSELILTSYNTILLLSVNPKTAGTLPSWPLYSDLAPTIPCTLVMATACAPRLLFLAPFNAESHSILLSRRLTTAEAFLALFAISAPFTPFAHLAVHPRRCTFERPHPLQDP